MDIKELVNNPFFSAVVGMATPLIIGGIYLIFVTLRKRVKLRQFIYDQGYNYVGPILDIPARKLAGKNQLEYRAYAKSLLNYLDMGVDDFLDGKPRRTDILEV